MSAPFKSTIILIPAYNAESTLGSLIKRIHTVNDQLRILVIDDGSSDTTLEIARNSGVSVLQHQENRGKGAALQTGFNHILPMNDVEYVVTMDSDLQHVPEEIPKLLSAQETTQADIVVGQRQRMGTHMPFARILSNTITSAMVGMRTGRKMLDSQCGFRLIRKSVLEEIVLLHSGYEAETEFLIKAARKGFNLAFAPIQTVYGNERSYIAHWATTKNFVKVLFQDYA